jgi:hypothetical protein
MRCVKTEKNLMALDDRGREFGLPTSRTRVCDQFREATRTKLVLEIASREIAPRVIPAAANKPRISCTIGERMWQERWGGIDFR